LETILLLLLEFLALGLSQLRSLGFEYPGVFLISLASLELVEGVSLVEALVGKLLPLEIARFAIGDSRLASLALISLGSVLGLCGALHVVEDFELFPPLVAGAIHFLATLDRRSVLAQILRLGQLVLIRGQFSASGGRFGGSSGRFGKGRFGRGRFGRGRCGRGSCALSGSRGL